MVAIRQLDQTGMDEVYSAFATAFADYTEPFHLTFEQFRHMQKRRGCDLSLSFGAFDRQKLIGFVLNGTGSWENQLTAYDTGTGIVKKYRNQGIASMLFNESLPILKANGIHQYLLEVIRTNTKAFDLYKKSGFEITRKFEYFVSQKSEITLNPNHLPEPFKISVMSSVRWDQFPTFWDFRPSWQNSVDAIGRVSEGFKIVGVFEKTKCIGYGIIETLSGDVPQFAVDRNYRRKGLGTALFNRLLSLTESDRIAVINTLTGNNATNMFLAGLGLTPGFGQYEMILKL